MTIQQILIFRVAEHFLKPNLVSITPTVNCTHPQSCHSHSLSTCYIPVYQLFTYTLFLHAIPAQVHHGFSMPSFERFCHHSNFWGRDRKSVVFHGEYSPRIMCATNVICSSSFLLLLPLLRHCVLPVFSMSLSAILWYKYTFDQWHQAPNCVNH